MSDLTRKLRERSGVYGRDVCLEAADEIDRLRDALEDAARIVESHDPIFSHTNSMLDNLAAEIRALAKEVGQ